MFPLKPPAPAEFQARFPEYPRVVRELLWQRGLRDQAGIDEFFNPDYGADLHDPFLLSGMEEAVSRILAAIQKREPVLVYGDYDADGVCSSALLVIALRMLGGQVDVYLPHRNAEGYGLSRSRIEQCIAEGVKLIVTVDTGITFGEEVARAQAAGVDVIICDHHLPPAVLPQAFAVVDPKLSGDRYPFKHLAACGVAFKLVQALSERAKDRVAPGWEKLFLDLVAVATIADVMPLRGENRTLVRAGLYILAHTARPGLKALMAVAGVEPKVLSSGQAVGHIPLTNLDAYTVSHLLAPRLNAASRMDHANASFELLMVEDAEIAAALARKLDEKNRERQTLVEETLRAVELTIDPLKLPPVIIAGSPDWSPGILGLVAGRLKDKYSRPAVLFWRGETESRGSCRSIDAFNIVEAMRGCGDIFIDMGGHPRAAGFTIPTENLVQFERCLTRTAAASLKPEDFESFAEAQAELSSREYTWELADWFSRMEPFGEANPEPILLMRGLEVIESRSVGDAARHLKLVLRPSDEPRRLLKAIAFGQGDGVTELRPTGLGRRMPSAGDRIQVLFRPSVNEWNGNRELELKIEAYEPETP
ncbi:single-stranded-DNA-specific exonuclease RecJ [Candidatus Parcubacteria bacterium]|nr:single-stranded-DNA-specific exonuclease RecJ [Candidatus Parcubacteria bacterium]